jgi:nucleotide-binding universal stress UspA family protein
MLGSVAEEVLRLALCPVLSVGPKAAAPKSAVANFSKIVFATDFGAASGKALPYALLLARDCRARLLLLHMVPPISVFDVGPAAFGPSVYAADHVMEWQTRRSDVSLRKLQGLIPSDVNLALAPEYLVETSFLPEGILDAAADSGAELIIMGANRTRSARLAAHIPWAVTHDVLCEARCPVLTVAS